MLPKNAKWVPYGIGSNNFLLICNEKDLASLHSPKRDDDYWTWETHLNFGTVFGRNKSFEKAKAAAEAYVSKWFEEVMR